ncbi:MAG TPA: ABC transporter permease, partial [Hyphomicrobiaceae bacterium]|nr:ABC transporter permease [Hyphomicrobiaceae bacterium]
MALSEALALELAEESPGARAWRRLVKRKGAVFGLVIIALFVAMAVLAPVLAPYDPVQQSWSTIRKPPS